MDKKVIYYGIFLSDAEAARLKQIMWPYIKPKEGWREYIHHMTISFGEPTDDVIKQYIADNMGKRITLQVIGYGQDNRAAAIQVSGSVSNNRIHHITMYVAPDAKPVDSNRIAHWNMMPSEIGPITVTGTVGAVYKD